MTLEARRRGADGTLRAVAFATAVCLSSSPTHARAADGRWSIGLETGPLAFSRNDVRIPGDGGTRFDLTRLIGTDAVPFVRLDGLWRIDERHSLRLVLAPLSVSDAGELSRETDFAGETFRAGATRATYQFDAYKLTYRYALAPRGGWTWGVGFTALVRDARIELRQGDVTAKDENVGVVPALHVSGDRRLGERWTLRFDVDGLAGGPGRLLDAAVKLSYELGDGWRIGGGYRTLEGGADTDDVYNFAWLNYAVLDIRYRL